MSKKHRHRPFQRDEQSAATTAQTPAQQETIMEATSQQDQAKSEPTVEALPPEPQGLTAKQMAQMEELNQARLLGLAKQQQEAPPPPPPNITDVVSKGYDELHEAIRKANVRHVKEYIPPPRTERQMSALQEELEAGRKAGERARRQQEEAQRQRAAHAAADAAKEGFTTPVYRPGDAVPDPITGKLGTFGTDA